MRTEEKEESTDLNKVIAGSNKFILEYGGGDEQEEEDHGFALARPEGGERRRGEDDDEEEEEKVRAQTQEGWCFSRGL